MDQQQPTGYDLTGGDGGDVTSTIGDDVSEALAAIQSALDVISQARLWSRSDQEAREGVREGFAVLGSMQACWLKLIADLDSRPEAVSGARAGLTAQTFLRARLLRTPAQAGADLRAVRALAPDADPALGGLPGLGAAFSAGLVSREHVDVAVKAVRRVPKAVLSAPLPADFAAVISTDHETHNTPETQEGQENQENQGGREGQEGVMTCGEAVDAFLTAQAQLHDPQQLAYLARHLLTALDPDNEDGFDPQATERRHLTQSTDTTGMVVGSFALGAVDGAWFSTAMNHFSAPNPTRTEYTDDGAPVVIRDLRTPAQRRADALGLISRLALSADDAGTVKGGERPRIVIHTGLDELHAVLNTTDDYPTHETDPEPVPDVEPVPVPGVEPDLDVEPELEFGLGVRLEPESGTASDAESGQETGIGPETGTGLETGPGDPHQRQHQHQHQHANTRRIGDQASEDRSATADQTAGQARATDPRHPRHPSHQVRPVRPAARGARHGRSSVGARLLSRYACDAVLAAALLSGDGAILDFGRDTRTINRAQRRALTARDRGCVMPGCTAPAEWAEGSLVTCGYGKKCWSG